MRLKLVAASVCGLLTLAGCELWNEANPVRQTVTVPCASCPAQGGTGGTGGDTVLACACVPQVRENGEASACTATWEGGPSACPWAAQNVTTGERDPGGSVARGGTIDPGQASAGAGRWVITICDCSVEFEADS